MFTQFKIIKCLVAVALQNEDGETTDDDLIDLWCDENPIHDCRRAIMKRFCREAYFADAKYRSEIPQPVFFK